VIDTVVAGFAADPLLRWVWPDANRYTRCSQPFFGLLLDVRLAGGEVWTAGDGAAVAMWDPPGGPYGPQPWRSWPGLQARFSAQERDRWARYEAAVGDREQAPHWYLGVLATDPDHRRQGLAAAAAAPMLAAADRTATPAWLETATASNVAYYATLGFTEVRHVDLPDGGPRCWLLRRDPASHPAREDGDT
jgi:GNAT superfamily N-acetyltransferase